MSTPADQPQTEPELRELIRRVLRGVYVPATLLSAFLVALGLVRAGQLVNKQIPPGRIESISGPTKAGPRLSLDNGDDVVFPDQVLDRQPRPVRLAVGDHIEKRRHSFAYVVNGVAVTDARWMLRNVLLPEGVLTLLVAYLCIGAASVLAYSSTPLRDAFCSNKRERPPWPRTRGGMLLSLLTSWLVVALGFTALLGCVFGCIAGAVMTLRG